MRLFLEFMAAVTDTATLASTDTGELPSRGPGAAASPRSTPSLGGGMGQGWEEGSGSGAKGGAAGGGVSTTATA